MEHIKVFYKIDEICKYLSSIDTPKYKKLYLEFLLDDYKEILETYADVIIEKHIKCNGYPPEFMKEDGVYDEAFGCMINQYEPLKNHIRDVLKPYIGKLIDQIYEEGTRIELRKFTFQELEMIRQKNNKKITENAGKFLKKYKPQLRNEIEYNIKDVEKVLNKEKELFKKYNYVIEYIDKLDLNVLSYERALNEICRYFEDIELGIEIVDVHEWAIRKSEKYECTELVNDLVTLALKDLKEINKIVDLLTINNSSDKEVTLNNFKWVLGTKTDKMKHLKEYLERKAILLKDKLMIDGRNTSDVNNKLMGNNVYKIKWNKGPQSFARLIKYLIDHGMLMEDDNFNVTLSETFLIKGKNDKMHRKFTNKEIADYRNKVKDDGNLNTYNILTKELEELRLDDEGV